MFDSLVTFFVNNPSWSSFGAEFLVIVMVVVGAFLVVGSGWALFDREYQDALWSFPLGATLLGLSLSLGSAMTQASHQRQAAIDAARHKAWVAARCPMYKSECGGRHKYSCERKGAVVGRNLVGDIAVEAYPTC